MRPWHASALLVLATLLSGCTGPADTIDGTYPAPGAGPIEGQVEAIEGDLHLTLTPGDCASYCLDALAENEGTATYHIVNICGSPFRDSMERDGEPVQHREPMVTCAAFGTEPFEPGANRTARFSWDATVWTDDGAAPAPEGSYQWSVTFTAYEEADGGASQEVTATVAIRV